MIIKPKIRGFICTTTHAAGCEANVHQQIEFVKSKEPLKNGPKNVLVVGASTGYGLASRIATAFGSEAATIGVFFEKEPSEKRPGTAGWYNSAAVHKAAKSAGLYAKSINGDAFSDDIKQQTVDLIKRDLGKIDLLVYSLASPRRTHPKTGQVFRSCLKPIGNVYHGKTVDTDKAIVHDVQIEPAEGDDIRDTIAVMGGEDWEMWVEALEGAGLLANGFKTLAFNYIGPKLTWPIYKDGTIGKAKEDLARAAKTLDARLQAIGGAAFISVMKAVVTQSSSAIPVVPLYIALLFKIMKAKGTHEGCIEQAQRLFSQRLYVGSPAETDEAGRFRLDDLEMQPEVQEEIQRIWPQIITENLHDLTDFAGYQEEFLNLFGFGLDGIDYDADVNPLVQMED